MTAPRAAPPAFGAPHPQCSTAGMAGRRLRVVVDELRSFAAGCGDDRPELVPPAEFRVAVVDGPGVVDLGPGGFGPGHSGSESGRALAVTRARLASLSSLARAGIHVLLRGPSQAFPLPPPPGPPAAHSRAPLDSPHLATVRRFRAAAAQPPFP